MLWDTKLTSIISQHSGYTSVSLENLRDSIISYTPQGPILYRTEEANVEYLQSALAGVEWAKPALTQYYVMTIRGPSIN